MNLKSICWERRQHVWLIRQSFGSHFHLGCCFALLTLSFGSSNVELTQWNGCMHCMVWPPFSHIFFLYFSHLSHPFLTQPPPPSSNEYGTLRSSSSKTVCRIVFVLVMLIGFVWAAGLRWKREGTGEGEPLKWLR